MNIISLVFVFVLGACLGSFLNCLVWRLIKGQKLGGRSACPQCHHAIAWFDNVPLLSFVSLGGHCRHCHKPIAHQYWLTELATALLFALAWWHNFGSADLSMLSRGQWLLLIRDWLAIVVLTSVFLMDLKWYVVADELTIPGIIVLLGFNLWLGIPWIHLVSAAIVGSGWFAWQYVASGGRWVGGGDIRLGALLGVLLGWPHILVALMISYIGGAVVGLALVAVRKKKMKSAVPFGAFLAPAALITLWWGQHLVSWYSNLLMRF